MKRTPKARQDQETRHRQQSNPEASSTEHDEKGSAKETPNTSRAFVETANHLAWIATTAAISTYSIGLLTVNFYLFTLGVSDFSLFRARFILTGAIAILPLLVLVAVLHILLTILQLLREEGLQRKRLSLIALGLGLFLIVLVSIRLAMLSVLTLDRHDYREELLIALLLIGSYGFVQMLIHDTTQTPTTLRDRRLTSAAVLGILTLIIATTVVYTAHFGREVFPHIPEQFGGGEPKRIRLIVQADGVKEAQTIGLEVSDTDLLSQEMLMYWETTEYLVISHIDERTGSVPTRVRSSLLTGWVPYLKWSPYADEPPSTPDALPSLSAS